jgi:gamma-glutamyltranspeptidase/glutathione hydrolase
MTAADLAGYRGRIERPTRLTIKLGEHTYDICKTGFWGQGPVLLQALRLLEGFDLARMGHNSTEYIHTVTEALKLALADRDELYGDPDFSRVPTVGLLSPAYAAERRRRIDPLRADIGKSPGDPWKFEPGAEAPPVRIATRHAVKATGPRKESPDTTTVNVVDARGTLFSASPSSAWFFGACSSRVTRASPSGTACRPSSSRSIIRTWSGGKRPRTTLSLTVVLRDGKPFLALSSPGGDSQDQQALQVLLNITVFNMRPQEAIEAPRVNSLHHEESFGTTAFSPPGSKSGSHPGSVVEALRRLGHKVEVLGPFMMNTGTVLAGVDAEHETVFGAADPRRQRSVTGW